MITIKEEPEYIQYAQNVEQALSQLEFQLHNSDDPEEVIMHMLAAATEFYDGDWAWVLEADLVMKVLSPLRWYNRRIVITMPGTFENSQVCDVRSPIAISTALVTK